MKKLIAACTLTVLAISAFAQLNGDGYYRVRNAKTGRYIHVENNKCNGINYVTQTADLSSIALAKNCSDYPTYTSPADIIYIKSVNGKYDLQAQGTGVYSMIQNYVSIAKVPASGYYRTYATNEGITLYLGDGNPASEGDYGDLNTKKDSSRDWEIIPVSSTTDNYAAVKPSFTMSNNGLYLTYYAAYPFSLASTGMKAWTVTKIDEKYGIAIIEEIDGTIPSGMPVIIKCKEYMPTKNRIEIGGTATTGVKSVMMGSYFNIRNGSKTNQVVYDKKTMRVLGEKNGKLAFVVGDESCLDNSSFNKATANDGLGLPAGTHYMSIPSNTAYIKVSENAPASFECMSLTEYNSFIEEQNKKEQEENPGGGEIGGGEEDDPSDNPGGGEIGGGEDDDPSDNPGGGEIGGGEEDDPSDNPGGGEIGGDEDDNPSDNPGGGETGGDEDDNPSDNPGGGDIGGDEDDNPSDNPGGGDIGGDDDDNPSDNPGGGDIGGDDDDNPSDNPGGGDIGGDDDDNPSDTPGGGEIGGDDDDNPSDNPGGGDIGGDDDDNPSDNPGGGDIGGDDDDDPSDNPGGGEIGGDEDDDPSDNPGGGEIGGGEDDAPIMDSVSDTLDNDAKVIRTYTAFGSIATPDYHGLVIEVLSNGKTRKVLR